VARTKIQKVRRTTNIHFGVSVQEQPSGFTFERNASSFDMSPMTEVEAKNRTLVERMSDLAELWQLEERLC
jgi:hypothetical protein